MPREGWKGINIPEHQYSELARVVVESPKYASVPEVVRDIIYLFLKEREAE